MFSGRGIGGGCFFFFRGGGGGGAESQEWMVFSTDLEDFQLKSLNQ